MVRIRRFLARLVVFICVLCLSYSFATLLVGDIALISGKNELEFNRILINIIGFVIALVGIIIYLTGRLSLQNLKGIRTCRVVSVIVFGGMIVLSLLYMYLCGEVKYVMLSLMVCLWVLLFGFLYILSKIEKTFIGEEDK